MVRKNPFQNPSSNVLSRARSLKRPEGSAIEEEVRTILKTHISAACSHQKDVQGIVDACFEKLKAWGCLAVDKASGFDKKETVEKTGDGTAYEGE